MSGVGVSVAQQTFQFAGNGAIPITPHQLRIKEISAQKACRYNQLWHSRLPIIKVGNVLRNRYAVCYGFFYNQICYAVGIWSSPVNQNFPIDSTIELRRYAIRDVAPKNTASWGLGLMVKLIKKKFGKIKLFISYQDTSVHKGTIYRAAGWVAKNKTKFADWSHKSRKRNKVQSNAEKIRWEFEGGAKK